MTSFKKIKPLLFVSAFLATSLFANENVEERISVGDRPMSVEDQQLYLEQRQEEALANSSQDLEEVQAQIFPSYYRPNYTRYSWHWINHVPQNGNEAILEDGSHWEINSWQAEQILSWGHEDAILITQNDAWCSSYSFCLYNKTRNTTVSCNLTISPIVGGQYTHSIQMINHGTGEIMLEDGTRWRLDRNDEYYSKDWLIHDLVIIGVNKYDWEPYANILINVSMNNYVKSSQL